MNFPTVWPPDRTGRSRRVLDRLRDAWCGRCWVSTCWASSSTSELGPTVPPTGETTGGSLDAYI